MEKRNVMVLAGRGGRVKDVALKHIAIKGTLWGPFGHFMIQHSFGNTGKKPIEIIYTLPLSSKVILENFKVKMGGKVLKSIMKRKEEAEQIYDDFVLDGDSAILLQQHRSNVFSLSIGNLAPQESLTIETKLWQLLDVTKGRIRILFPTVVGPRYIPGVPLGQREGFGWSPPTGRVPDADWITPPVSPNGVPYRVSLDLWIPGKVREVESPSHPLKVQREENGTRIQFALNERADRDVVIYLDFGKDNTNWAILGEGIERKVGFFSIGPLPSNFKREDTPKDYIFLLDRSGSMAGEKIESSKRALKLALRMLNEEDRFFIAVFDSTYETFKDEFSEFGEESLVQADRWIDNIEARGGTELYPTLQRALKLGKEKQRDNVVVIITDGEVGNEKEIAELFEDFHGKALLFGIDTAVNEELFKSILATTSGWVEYIYPGEDLEEKVTLNFQRLFYPEIEEIEFESGDIRVENVYPRLPAGMNPDGMTSFIFTFEGIPQDTIRCRLKLSNGEVLEVETPINKGSIDETKLVEKLWVKRKIEKLERTMRKYPPLSRRAKRIKEKIEDLALRYQLQTKFTNWVAVYERDNKLIELPEIQVIPQELPRGWQYHRVFLTKSILYCETSIEPSKERPVKHSKYYSRDLGKISTPKDLILYQEWDGKFNFPALRKKPFWIQTAVVLLLIGILSEIGALNLSIYSKIIEKSLKYIKENLDLNDERGILITLLAITLLKKARSLRDGTHLKELESQIAKVVTLTQEDLTEKTSFLTEKVQKWMPDGKIKKNIEKYPPKLLKLVYKLKK